MVQIGPVEVRREKGREIQLYGRTLTPVALVIRAIRRRGTIGARGTDGSGWGAAMVIPEVVIEEQDGECRALPVCDETTRLLLQMAVVAAMAPLLTALLLWLNHLMRE